MTTNASIKLAVIDGDGVLWNNDARMAIADKAAALVSDALNLIPDARWDRVVAARWSMAFDPALVELDRMNVGSESALSLLEDNGWSCVVLTSNPETTRAARESWLARHNLTSMLILKDTGDDADPRDRYTTTPQWKVNQVYHLLEQFGDKVDTLLFVDDSDRNRSAITVAFGNDQAMSVIVTDSLDLAVSLVRPPQAGDSQDFKYRINPEG